MEFVGDFSWKHFVEGSVDHIIYRDYIANRRPVYLLQSGLLTILSIFFVFFFFFGGGGGARQPSKSKHFYFLV